MQEFSKLKETLFLLSDETSSESLNFEFIPFTNNLQTMRSQKEPSQKEDDFDKDDELVQKKKSRISKKDLQVES
jgi:hypothetical protein